MSKHHPLKELSEKVEKILAEKEKEKEEKEKEKEEKQKREQELKQAKIEKAREDQMLYLQKQLEIISKKLEYQNTKQIKDKIEIDDVKIKKESKKRKNREEKEASLQTQKKYKEIYSGDPNEEELDEPVITESSRSFKE